MKIDKEVALWKKKKEKIGVCYGVFEILHPGHFRYLRYARSFCDKLILVISDDSTSKASSKDRIDNISSLKYCDACLSVGKNTLIEILDNLKPDFFIVGREFIEERKFEIEGVVECLANFGGQIKYFSEQRSKIFNQENTIHAEKINTSKISSFMSDNMLTKQYLLKTVDKFKKSSILVIGDTIIDEYIHTEPLGISSEAPVIAVNELSRERFLGGAAIVSSHFASLGALTKFISVIGADDASQFVSQGLETVGVQSLLFQDPNRPTSLKSRYLVDKQKIFRSSKLSDVPIPDDFKKQVLAAVKKNIVGCDRFIFSDFSYGVITHGLVKTIIEENPNSNNKMSGDSQTGSQFGDLKKFQNFDTLFPTEKEARALFNDNHNTIDFVARKLYDLLLPRVLFLKLGADGFLVFFKSQDGSLDRIFVPAFCDRPIDVSGAGDALMSIVNISLSIDDNVKVAAVLGGIGAAIAVGNLGNKAIGAKDLKQVINFL